MIESRAAIIGSGIAGLACAEHLTKSGAHVTLFDKSRGPGGRVTTRRADVGRFDHGAQYFTATHPDFLRQVEEWENQGWVQQWLGRFGDWRDGQFHRENEAKKRWVGVPRMSAIGRMMAQNLDVRLQHKVVHLSRRHNQWFVTCDNDQIDGPFDWVVLTCPGPQAAALLPDTSSLHSSVQSLCYEPCWAVMMSFDHPLDLPLDGIRLDHPVLAWAARDNSKPNRAEGERWVLHAQAKWSEIHVDDPPDQVLNSMTSAFDALLDKPARPTHKAIHRWLYARASTKQFNQPTIDPKNRLAICGDATQGSRLENAWLSGDAMASALGEHLG